MTLPQQWSWLTMILDPDRPQTSKLWTLPFDGEDVTIATDGRRLVMIPGAFGDSVPEEKTAETLRKALTPGENRSRIEWAALRDFVGTVEDPKDCKTCSGTGQSGKCDACDNGMVDCECSCGDLHEKECEECEGTGKPECPDCRHLYEIDPIRIGAAPFNRRLLAPLVSRLSAERVAFAQSAIDKPAIFATKEWRLVMMPLRDDESLEKWRNAPRFEITATASAA